MEQYCTRSTALITKSCLPWLLHANCGLQCCSFVWEFYFMRTVVYVIVYGSAICKPEIGPRGTIDSCTFMYINSGGLELWRCLDQER